MLVAVLCNGRLANSSMTPERKKYLSEKRKQHNIDRKQAKAIEALGIHPYPLDLPSLDRAVFGDRKPRWLTTGFDWIDKPHRVANDAMKEIRALRAYILANIQTQTGGATPPPKGTQ